MRTLEQIDKELRAAREEATQANKRVEKLEQEAKEIYLAAKKLLGIEDKPTFRGHGLLPNAGDAGMPLFPR